MAEDAVTAAPHAYRVIFENERVRVLEARLTPGATTELHWHPELVAVAITDGHYRFGLPNGESMEAQLNAGEAAFFEAVEHTTENLGDSDGVTILVELK